jgi:hypothetical protein
VDTYTASSATFTITAPSTNNGSVITGYTVASCDFVIGGSSCDATNNTFVDMVVNDATAASVAASVDLASNSNAFGAIRQGYTREFAISAVNAAGAGDPIVVTENLAYDAPDAPTGISITPSRVGGSLAFTPGANWGVNTIDELQFSVDGGSTWDDVDVDAPTYARSAGTITGLAGGTDYTLILRGARDSEGVYGPSSVSTEFTTLSGPPATAYDDTCDLGGSGTSADPYLVTGLNDLYEIRDCGPDVVGTVFKQTADIDMADSFDPSSLFDDGQASPSWGWMPLGQDPINGPSPFTYWAADYDGGGFTISNFAMEVDGFTPSLQGVGFFGEIIAGTISDLSFVNASVTNSGYAASTGVLGSVVAGKQEQLMSPPPPPPATLGGDVVISNVSVTGTVDNQTTPFSPFAVFGTGGLVGSVSVGDRTYTTTITDVFADLTVTATGANTGGLIGEMRAGSVDGGIADGSVTGADNVGGLIGSVGTMLPPSGPDLSNLHSSAEVSGTGSDIGGAVGINNGPQTYPGSIENVSWNLDASGQASSALAPPIMGLTSSEASDPSNFPGLDFSVWGVCSEVNGGVPVLQDAVTLPSGLEWADDGTCLEASNDDADDSTSESDPGSGGGDSDDGGQESSQSTSSPSDDSDGGVALLDPPSDPTPTLLDETELAAAVRSPGEVLLTANGEPQTAQVHRIDPDALGSDPSNRSDDQITAIREQAREMVESFNDLLPEGTARTVTVVDTDNGAVVRGVAVKPSDGSSGIDVPAEDVVVVTSNATGLLVAGVDGDDSASQVGADGVLRINPGGYVAVSAVGLTPGAAGEVVVMSTPTMIGTFSVGSAGGFSGQMRLPDGVVGEHTVVATADGVTFSMGIVIVPAGTLPATGGPVSMVNLSALLVVFGGLISLGRRRWTQETV